MVEAIEFPLVYDGLRRIAAAYFRERPPGDTLQPTALVHEAYLKLARASEASYHDRAHFVAVAAKAMRQILVDHARRKAAVKRDAVVGRISWDLCGPGAQESEVDVLALDEALERLHALDDRKARVVELRVFGGLTIEETAKALGISTMTVSTDWRFARAWLAIELCPDAHE